MAQRQYDPGEAELDVLKALWDLGKATVRDVLTHMHDRGRRVAYTTVQTLLTRLEQKGYVVSDKSEFAHVFRPKVSRDRILRSRLKSLVQGLYDGAAGPLVLQLIRTEHFTTQEVEELQKLIDRLDKEGGAARAGSPVDEQKRNDRP